MDYSRRDLKRFVFKEKKKIYVPPSHGASHTSHHIPASQYVNVKHHNEKDKKHTK
jgi:hypothetical protein